MYLAGIYVSSMSSCLGAMYGTPRVLQSIANEQVIPIISVLGQGVSATVTKFIVENYNISYVAFFFFFSEARIRYQFWRWWLSR
jgi:amino acid transporter